MLQAALGADHRYDSELQEIKRLSFTPVFCRAWASSYLLRLGQVFPFHKELKQLDVEIERHVKEEVLPGEQLVVEAGGKAVGNHACTTWSVLVQRETHGANTARAPATTHLTAPHCVQGNF